MKNESYRSIELTSYRCIALYLVGSERSGLVSRYVIRIVAVLVVGILQIQHVCFYRRFSKFRGGN
jgi:hypothetical protein